MTSTVGMVGLGIMGSAMSANLLDAGFAVVGCDIDADKAAALANKGGTVVANPMQVAAAAAIVITSLPSIPALDAVYTGENGLAASGRQGLIVIDAGTFPIDDKTRVHDALAANGMVVLDCPLSGTGAQAVTKDLAVLASGAEDAYEACRAVFEGFARAHYYLGEFGNGSKMKFVANLLVAIHNLSAAEAFVLGMKSGLAPDMIMKVIADGAGNSRMFEVRGPMMVAGDYSAATMKVDVWQKDMKVIGDFAAKLGSPTPLFSASNAYYLAALSQGMGDQDTASVCAVLEDMANFKRPA